MRTLRLLFAPELGRPLAEALRSAADLLRGLEEARRGRGAGSVGCGGAGTGDAMRAGSRKGRSRSRSGLAILLVILALAGLGLTMVPPPEPASAQAIDRGLFADTDSATRDVLGFLGGLGAHGPSAVGDMLFAFNAGVLVLAGFLLVWHAAAGTVDTAREGRFGFGAWAIVRIVTAIALMAPLPGGLNGAQHAVVGLAHLGGDFANAVWRPFSEEALAESRPIVPRPREALWRAAISRTLIAETCASAANGSAFLAGDDPYVEIREEDDDGIASLHYDGDGRGMPDDMCGAIRFSGIEADGAPGIAAQGHRRALTGLLPALRSIAAGLAAHYVPGTPLYGRPLPDIDALLARQDLAGSYARVLDDALTDAASEERETLARVVAEDAREASWMAAASFFNTIAHRVGLFQAAAHNVPAVALPVPSLDEWSPAADAAVKGVAAQLARSRQYHPMLLSAANAGAGALPAAGGGGGGMVSGLLEFIDLDSVIVADSGNPIADLAALGHGLLNAALAAIAALMGAATGSGLLESIPFIGKGLDVFESAWQVSDALVSTLLGLLIISGAVLAYVLPAKRDLLIVIDEMPRLGYLKPVMDGYTMAAGKGVHFWCFAQSISALDSTWGKEHRKTLLHLAELVQVLGFPRTDAEGAEELSKAIGTATFEGRTESRSGTVAESRIVTANTQWQAGESTTLVRERLVTPDELMTLGPDRQYVIAAAKDMPRDALHLHHARHWVRRDARFLADPNPFVLRKERAAGKADTGGRLRWLLSIAGGSVK